jgi:hypothetical protein
MSIAEMFIAHLASLVNVSIDTEDYRRIDLRQDLSGPELNLDDLILFTVPAAWTSRPRRVLFERLISKQARIFTVDADGPAELTDAAISEVCDSHQEERLGVLPVGDEAASVRRLLDIAGTMAGSSEDASRLAALQWNPTWSMHPHLSWRPGEQQDSGLTVRSFTSARVARSTGETLIRDAELHMAGVEVAHVREYASVPAMMEQAEEAGSPADLSYLENTGDVAPPGMVGLFFGWERLVSVLLGLSGVDRAVLFPRQGSGYLEATDHSVLGRNAN